MAVHSFTGVTGKITASGTVVGFVSGDLSLTTATGKYVTLGGNTATAHTRGLKSVSGTLKRAWGISDSTLYTWFNTDAEIDIEFDADAVGTHTYTATTCVITDLSIEGLEAGSDGALMINASFEGLSWSRDA
tara:strand:+ start:1126 stop:1521 length:396 start_codon:yes stop_codon:yes gene_type:complete